MSGYSVTLQASSYLGQGLGVLTVKHLDEKNGGYPPPLEVCVTYDVADTATPREAMKAVIDELHKHV